MSYGASRVESPPLFYTVESFVQCTHCWMISIWRIDMLTSALNFLSVFMYFLFFLHKIPPFPIKINNSVSLTLQNHWPSTKRCLGNNSHSCDHTPWHSTNNPSLLTLHLHSTLVYSVVFRPWLFSTTLRTRLGEHLLNRGIYTRRMAAGASAQLPDLSVQSLWVHRVLTF